MKKILWPPPMPVGKASLCLGLIFVCSCTTNQPCSPPSTARPPLPDEVSFNPSAGHGGHLFIYLHLEAEKEVLPFMLDTGMPITVLDGSLNAKLGQCLGTNRFRYAWYGKKNLGEYKMPALYLGNTRLLTGDQVTTMYLQRWSIESFANDARGFLTIMNDQGQLPGLNKGDHGHFYCDWPLNKNQKADGVETYPVRRSFSFFKGDSSIYHYTVVLTSPDHDWVLQKAWRTDANEHLVEEYVVP